MKEYKFRAWDRKEKRYQHCLWINSNGTIRVSPTGDPEKYHCLEDKRYTGRYEIEQYTGLKDKNGIEIYNGDFLNDGGFGLLEVFWSESDGCTYVRHIGMNGHLCGDDLCCYTDRLVCGNIHESISI